MGEGKNEKQNVQVVEQSVQIEAQGEGTRLELTTQDLEWIEFTTHRYQQIKEELKKRIVGLEDVIEQLLLAILSGGHALLIGVPGLAKTLLIRSLAELLDLKFARIQFTPDLMPSDITGTEILVQQEDGANSFKFLPGPIFAQIILADEINRTPPKTQSALLEAMEEHTVSSVGRRFVVEPPFFVLATQNPIEQEGTYPLPVAQLDRFMFNIFLGYPSVQEENAIMRLTLSCDPVPLQPILSKKDILHSMHLARKIAISPEMTRYALSLCRFSRPQVPGAPSFIRDFIAWGCSPRAAQGLILGSKARALLHGRSSVTDSDIRTIAHPVMRHRILLNYRAEAEGFTPDDILARLIQTIPAPHREGKRDRGRTQKYYMVRKT